MKTRFLILVFALFVLIGAIVGCSGGGSSDRDNRVTLELGETSSYDTIHVETTGSLMSVNIAGDQLDGFQLGIPNGSYDEGIDVTVSYTPIVSHSGNEYFDPVSPLISVENGGKYSDKIMTMKIPVEMEDGYHYMAFYYDKSTGKLEGIPELEHDEESLTIATRHFSSIVLNRIGQALLHEDFESDFEVTKDSWPFDNSGTYISDDGMCSGMTSSALYYYHEKKKKLGEADLFGRYNNATVGLVLDDSQAIKLTSIVQEGMDWRDEVRYHWIELEERTSDLFTYFMFAHAILLTGEPQYVAIFESSNDIGHAMLVYKKSSSQEFGDNLHVYDPNLPNDKNVKIEFEFWVDANATKLTGSFKPFESQWNSGSEKIDFDKIIYIGQSAVLEHDFDDLWNDLENNEQEFDKEFPYYDFQVVKEDVFGGTSFTPLTDGFQTTDSSMEIEIQSNGFPSRISIYSNEEKIKSSETGKVEIDLGQGENKIGFLVEGKTDKGNWRWVDFKYFNIELDAEDDVPAPPNSSQESSIIVNNTYDEKVNVYIKKCVENSCWSVSSGSLEPGETGTHTVEQGEYSILIFVSNNTSVKWTRDITLSEQDYTYDFTATQDCSLARVAITNQTQYTLYYRPRGIDISPWLSRSDPGEQTNFYLEPEESYTSWAQAYTGCPSGVNLSHECYTCWSEPINELNCQGDEWTVSGNGFTCPPN